MTEITRFFDVPEPFPVAELRLPGNGGAVKVKLKRVEGRGEEVWLLVEAPRWNRWSTQVNVGEKAHEGISPGTEDIWAPAFAVSTEPEIYDQLESLYSLGV
ncbi:hypothetical protein OG337_28850 [[Kitasatospora] papulosa]|jgi:hypothetical protein|uniref:hypothetical protein n=1 Tax=[Kitasatospora] papulosa TaxID=1464011 RepID=UPI003864ED63|nr:hypothetical protein OG337_28850 [[Kitasatospora] papulosa]